MENEFCVHGNIVSFTSESLRGILAQPQNNDKKNTGQKITFELPSNVNNQVALQFFTIIYKQTAPSFTADPNLDSLDLKELVSLFELSDMYLFDVGKDLVKQNLKKRCKKSVDKNYPKEEYTKENFEIISEDQKKDLCNLFVSSVQINLQFENFKTLDSLFTTYSLYHYKDSKKSTLKQFEYVATQRKNDDENYNDWGGFFFQLLIHCVQNTKKLTWQKATKNISFKPADWEDVEDLIQKLTTEPDFKKIYMNYKLMRDILVTIKVKRG